MPRFRAALLAAIRWPAAAADPALLVTLGTALVAAAAHAATGAWWVWLLAAGVLLLARAGVAVFVAAAEAAIRARGGGE